MMPGAERLKSPQQRRKALRTAQGFNGSRWMIDRRFDGLRSASDGAPSPPAPLPRGAGERGELRSRFGGHWAASDGSPSPPAPLPREAGERGELRSRFGGHRSASDGAPSPRPPSPASQGRGRTSSRFRTSQPVIPREAPRGTVLARAPLRADRGIYFPNRQAVRRAAVLALPRPVGEGRHCVVIAAISIAGANARPSRLRRPRGRHSPYLHTVQSAQADFVWLLRRIHSLCRPRAEPSTAGVLRP
jgi:hypothetical protein